MQQSQSVKLPVRPLQHGRVAEMLSQQRKAREELVLDPILDLRTVSAALGNASYSYIRKLIRGGTLKAFRIGKGHYKVRQSALRELLAQGDGVSHD